MWGLRQGEIITCMAFYGLARTFLNYAGPILVLEIVLLKDGFKIARQNLFEL